MKDIKIKIEKQTSKVFPDGDILGISMENLQGSIICYFDEFVDGVAWLEVQMPDETKGYFMMEKVDETYVLPIKSSLLKESGLINMQFRITEGTNIEEIPVYKSNIFYCKVKEAINSITEIPEEYPQWIDMANIKLNEIDNLNISANKIEKVATITITKKDGTEQVTEIYDGEDYILTDEDKEEIADTVKPMVETDIQPILENIENIAENAKVIAEGASQALNYLDYEDMVNNFNAFDKNKFNTGRNIMIKKLNVPDAWIYGLSEEYVEYTYTTDEDLINLLISDRGLQVGYYILSPLETQKVDLTDYAKKEQFITLTQEEYDALEEKSANTYYFIIEEE